MSAPVFDRHYYDGNNWKFGCLYFCRADRRLVVRRRLRGLGWTVNFARPLALPFVGFLLALAYGVGELAGSRGDDGDLRFAVKLLLVLGLMALCYRLSIPRADSASPDDPAAGAQG